MSSDHAPPQFTLVESTSDSPPSDAWLTAAVAVLMAAQEVRKQNTPDDGHAATDVGITSSAAQDDER